ncbi:MAG: radical SAM protein [Planctomycetota bacterium]|nr:MAG: radical SAM protein [Planctomycetota bacterium]
MIEYVEPVIRPPSEARSLLLQVTLGCSHNKCTFCGTYLTKPFRVKPLEEALAEIEWARGRFGEVRRVFLCDGDALVLPTEDLVAILDKINECFPSLQRVGTYANATNILNKSEEELRLLREKKLKIAYLGLESGNEEVLRRAKKGNTARQAVDAVLKAQRAGIKMSVMTLLGLGGKDLTREHARDSAAALNEMNPRFASFLTVVVLPGTTLWKHREEGKFKELSRIEVVRELREVIEKLDVKNCVIRSNHVSNLVALAGNLPKDRESMLARIDAVLADPSLMLRRRSRYLL